MPLFVAVPAAARPAQRGWARKWGSCGRESSEKRQLERPSGGDPSGSNRGGGNNWQLGIGSVMIIYQVVKNRVSALQNCALKKKT